MIGPASGRRSCGPEREPCPGPGPRCGSVACCRTARRSWTSPFRMNDDRCPARVFRSSACVGSTNWRTRPVIRPGSGRKRDPCRNACGPQRRTVVDLVLRSTQRRLVTAPRLLAALRAWPRHRWRALLGEILSEVEAGVARHWSFATPETSNEPTVCLAVGAMPRKTWRKAQFAGTAMFATRTSAPWWNSTAERRTRSRRHSAICAGTTWSWPPETRSCVTAGGTSMCWPVRSPSRSASFSSGKAGPVSRGPAAPPAESGKRQRGTSDPQHESDVPQQDGSEVSGAGRR